VINPQKRRKKWCVGPEKVVRKPCPPDLDLNTLLATAARSLGFDLVKSNDYDNVLKNLRAHSGDKIIYFSSRRFVDWCGPETLASYAVEVGLTAGAEAEDVATKAQHQVFLELDDILASVDAE
jgi:hypothetical protein